MEESAALRAGRATLLLMELPEERDDKMLNEQRQCGAGYAADDSVYNRHPCVEMPIVRSIFEPLNFLAFVFGCLFAHFVLGPLIFG